MRQLRIVAVTFTGYMPGPTALSQTFPKVGELKGEIEGTQEFVPVSRRPEVPRRAGSKRRGLQVCFEDITLGAGEALLDHDSPRLPGESPNGSKDKVIWGPERSCVCSAAAIKTVEPERLSLRCPDFRPACPLRGCNSLPSCNRNRRLFASCNNSFRFARCI
jgi:hypothetical protein